MPIMPEGMHVSGLGARQFPCPMPEGFIEQYARKVYPPEGVPADEYIETVKLKDEPLDQDYLKVVPRKAFFEVPAQAEVVGTRQIRVPYPWAVRRVKAEGPTPFPVDMVDPTWAGPGQYRKKSRREMEEEAEEAVGQLRVPDDMPLSGLGFDISTVISQATQVATSIYSARAEKEKAAAEKAKADALRLAIEAQKAQAEAQTRVAAVGDKDTMTWILLGVGGLAAVGLVAYLVTRK